jgi:hypothetical protein
VIVNHKAPYLLRQRGSESDEAFLLGVLSSLPFDWYTRRYVEISMSFDHLNSMPIPDLGPDDPLRSRITHVAGTLAAVDDRSQAWAAAVGVSVGSTADLTRADLLAELDALVAAGYGLDRDDLNIIFSTFHPSWDHSARLDATIAHFEAL